MYMLYTNPLSCSVRQLMVGPAVYRAPAVEMFARREYIISRLSSDIWIGNSAVFMSRMLCQRPESGCGVFRPGRTLWRYCSGPEKLPIDPRDPIAGVKGKGCFLGSGRISSILLSTAAAISGGSMDTVTSSGGPPHASSSSSSQKQDIHRIA